MSEPSCEIRPIQTSDTRPLRQSVLRPDLEEVYYRGDDAPTTGHFGAFVSDRLVGVVSVFEEGLEAIDGFPNSPSQSWRIRGLAVEESMRGKGFGTKLIEACIQYASDRGGNFIWCVARCSAEIVYIRQGFLRQGNVFRLEGIGPVCHMIRPIHRL